MEGNLITRHANPIEASFQVSERRYMNRSAPKVDLFSFRFFWKGMEGNLCTAHAVSIEATFQTFGRAPFAFSFFILR